MYDVFQGTPNLVSMMMMTRAGHEASHLDTTWHISILVYGNHNSATTLWLKQVMVGLAAQAVKAVNINRSS
jgi:hypothetical protein